MQTPRSSLPVFLFAMFAVVTGLFAFPAQAGGPRVEFTILDDTDRDRGKTESASYGKGKKEKQEVTFTLKILNREFNALKNLKVEVLIFAENPFERRSSYKLKKTLASKPFDLNFNETMELTLGTVDFSHGSSSKATGANEVTIYYSGDSYGGWAAKLYQDGAVADTYFSDSRAKKAFSKLKD